MGKCLGELQHCNSATQVGARNTFQIKKHHFFNRTDDFFCVNIREPQWQCCTFAASIEMQRRATTTRGKSREPRHESTEPPHARKKALCSLEERADKEGGQTGREFFLIFNF